MQREAYSSSSCTAATGPKSATSGVLLEVSINLQDQFITNPYPAYAELRRLGQPYFIPHHPADTNRTAGMWLLSTYDQAQSVLNDTDNFTKNNAAFRTQGAEPGFDASMLFQDEPEHRRLRSLVEDLFRRTAIERYKEIASVKARQLLADLEPGSRVNLIDAYAESMPLLVITELLGIPTSQMPLLRRLSQAITTASDDLTVTAETHAARAVAYRDLAKLMQAGMNGEWETAEDSLLRRLQILNRDSLLSQEHAISMLLLLLFAGHETSIALIGSCLCLLFSHPEQLRLIRENPDLLSGAIEETLRLESPLQRSTFRMTLRDLSIDGHQFGPGEQISVILGSANRDEKVFSDPDQFIVRRFPNPHLAFGRGSYHCIGRHLSVLEARIAVQIFLEHFPNSSLAGEPSWHRNSFVRTLQDLSFFLEA